MPEKVRLCLRHRCRWNPGLLCQEEFVMRFEFATATRILFGPGTVQEVASLALGMGTRAFVVTGRSA
jgi:hypothetical protein